MSPPIDPFTYDDLTEVARREKNSRNITDVRKDLYRVIWEYREGLKRASERELSADPFSTKYKLANNQLEEFKKKSEEVFRFRMGKILNMALRSAEGNRVETARLTIEEHDIFDEVLSILKERRSYMLEGTRNKIVEAEEPSLNSISVPDMVAEARREEEYVNPLIEERPDDLPEILRSEEIAAPPSGPREEPKEENEQENATLLECSSDTKAAPEFLVLRILEDIPAFVGPDRTYRLRKEDLVCLPSGISKVLIARKKAVVVPVTS